MEVPNLRPNPAKFVAFLAAMRTEVLICCSFFWRAAALFRCKGKICSGER